MVAENSYITESTYTYTDSNGNTRTRTVYYHHNNDLIVIKISKDGEIKWMDKIMKTQNVSSTSRYNSYALFVKGESLYFVFNDNEKNLTIGENESAYTFSGANKKAIVSVVELLPNGKQNRKMLFDVRDERRLLRPGLCYQSLEEKDVAYMFGSFKKKYSLITLKLK